MRIILSIVLGMLPEVLYYVLFISITKNIKEKRIKLFILISIAYFLCILIQRWQILFYILWIALTYIALKLTYKKKAQIIDIFIVSLAYFWMMLLSSILMPFINKDMSNYMMIYGLQRILLFVPFIFKNKFNKIYKKYCKLWNRNDKEKRPIKSITLRNSSLILLNVFIFLMNISISNIINFSK